MRIGQKKKKKKKRKDRQPFQTSDCFLCLLSLDKIISPPVRAALEGKNLLYLGANSFLQEQASISRETNFVISE